MIPDWIVSKITPTADALKDPRAHYRLHVEVTTETGRGSWSVRDVSNPRYDISGADIDPRALPFLGRELPEVTP